jgi:outer membrane lipoprotein-sorting protein
MLRRYKALSLLVLLLPFLHAFYVPAEQKTAAIFKQMYDSIEHIKTLRQNVIAIERIEGKYSTNRSSIKVQTNPRKVYFINRAKKLEILFDAEANAHKALVKPHIFPYLTMSLDPMGNIMRHNQHYSLNELGYDFIGKSVALTINKDKHGLSNFTYRGKVMKNGYNCFFIEYENRSYTYVDYVVKEKETVTSIAYRLCVNDYLLRYRNDLLNDFGYLKKGRILKVPNLYCQKAVLYIDDRLYLPVALSLYDDEGLFESYEYTNVQVNKPFNEKEFERDFPDYNF